MRLLVLEGARLAVLGAAIESVEPAVDLSTPWLADLVYGVTTTPTPDQDRRTLCLRGGGAVNVPAAMHIIEDVEILELSDLLCQLGVGGGTVGVIGIAELRDGLSIVCDPREILALTGASTTPHHPGTQGGQ